MTRTTRRRTSPSRVYRNVPAIDDGMIEGSVLPTAWSGVAPSTRIAGVEMTAPPTPKTPESIPVKNPAIRTRTKITGSDIEATLPTSGRYPGPMSDGLQLRGVYVPLITPFAADGSVAVDAITVLAQEYLDAGATGLVPLGTTGESAALAADEKRAVIDACSAVCVERGAQLIVGAGTNSTATTVAAVQGLAGTSGLSAALIVVPYYVRPSEAGIVAHFRAVADASPVPVVLYNVGLRTGRNLSAAGVLEAATHPNVIGIKQAATGLDLGKARKIVATVTGANETELFARVAWYLDNHVSTSQFRFVSVFGIRIERSQSTLSIK